MNLNCFWRNFVIWTNCRNLMCSFYYLFHSFLYCQYVWLLGILLSWIIETFIGIVRNKINIARTLTLGSSFFWVFEFLVWVATKQLKWMGCAMGWCCAIKITSFILFDVVPNKPQSVCLFWWEENRFVDTYTQLHQ